MKIAIVILHADPARGGAERYTVDLAHALIKRGHEVTLLASSFADLTRATGPLPREREPDSPSPSMLGEGPHRIQLAATGFTRSQRYKHFLDSLDAHLSASAYDIIHAMLPVRQCDLYHPHAGMAIDALRQKSWMMRMQNRMNRRGTFAQVEWKLLTSPNGPTVLALSEYVQASIKGAYPQLPPDRLETLFNAVDLERFSPHPAAESSGRGLMVAQDFARKGLEVTIRALAHAPNVTLTVIGKEDPTPWRNLARSLAVSDRLTFAGPQTDVRPFYRDADFFVLPTKHDPCSLVVLEALAMGLPVISTKFNGACEIMEQGRHGFIMNDPNNIGQLAEALRELCGPATRTRMSAACLELRPRLSYEHHLDQLLRIYQRARHRRER